MVGQHDRWQSLWPEPEEIPAGTVLFRQGDPVEEVLSVSEGLIGLTRLAADRETTLGLRTSGSLIGGLSGALQLNQRTGAIALMPTRVQRLAVSRFRDALRDSVEFSRDGLQAMKRESDADLCDTTRALLPAPERRLSNLLSSLRCRRDIPPILRDTLEIRLPADLPITVWCDLLHLTAPELHGLFLQCESAGDLRKDSGALVFRLARNSTHLATGDPPAPPLRGAGARDDHQSSRIRPPDVVDDRVVKAIELIDSQYSNAALSLRDVSRKVNVSLWHLSRLFKQATGVGFRQFLNRVRLDHVRAALVETPLTVKEISAIVGYNHVSHLTRTFTSTYGVSPIQYRARRIESLTSENPIDDDYSWKPLGTSPDDAASKVNSFARIDNR
jgi:AraC-like DNA-binding protein/CRP-like cAMP-binding protein